MRRASSTWASSPAHAQAQGEVAPGHQVEGCEFHRAAQGGHRSLVPRAVVPDEARVREHARIAGRQLHRFLGRRLRLRPLLLDVGSEDVDHALDQVEAQEGVRRGVARVELDGAAHLAAAPFRARRG